MLFSSKPDPLFNVLNLMNWTAAVLHFVQFVVTLVLAIKYTDFSQPVYSQYFSEDREEMVFEQTSGWQIVYMVPSFLLTCFASHVYVLWFREEYVGKLVNFTNPVRWAECSISAPLMIVCIGMLGGLSTISEIVMAWALCFCSYWFGWAFEEINSAEMMEEHREASSSAVTGGGGGGGGEEEIKEPVTNNNTAAAADAHNPYVFEVDWTAFYAGLVPTIMMWIALLIPFIRSITVIHGFVIGILVSTFFVFNCFPAVTVYQFRSPRSLTKYLKGEAVFIILSFSVKSLLAWQLVAGIIFR